MREDTLIKGIVKDRPRLTLEVVSVVEADVHPVHTPEGEEKVSGIGKTR